MGTMGEKCRLISTPVNEKFKFSRKQHYEVHGIDLQLWELEKFNDLS